MTNNQNYKLLFQVGDDVQYEHPIYGPGKGIIAAYNERANDFVVFPNKTIKGIEYIICEPQHLINTPF